MLSAFFGGSSRGRKREGGRKGIRAKSGSLCAGFSCSLNWRFICSFHDCFLCPECLLDWLDNWFSLNLYILFYSQIPRHPGNCLLQWLIQLLLLTALLFGWVCIVILLLFSRFLYTCISLIIALLLQEMQTNSYYLIYF